MGDGEKASLRLQFNPKVRLAFHGATITTDAGLLAFREFDDALGLTEIAEDYLQESRTGRNILHHLVPLLRQSIYSRLAGYDDTNDAVRLSQDPAMRVIVGWQGSERKGASTSEMGRVETEFLTQEDMEGRLLVQYQGQTIPTREAPPRSGMLRAIAVAPMEASGPSHNINGAGGQWDACLGRLETGEVDRDLRPRKSKAQQHRIPTARQRTLWENVQEARLSPNPPKDGV